MLKTYTNAHRHMHTPVPSCKEVIAQQKKMSFPTDSGISCPTLCLQTQPHQFSIYFMFHSSMKIYTEKHNETNRDRFL